MESKRVERKTVPPREAAEDKYRALSLLLWLAVRICSSRAWNHLHIAELWIDTYRGNPCDPVYSG